MSSISIVFFERDLNDADSESVVEEWLEEITKEELAGTYSVVLHNDPINGVDFVTRVIHAVFGYGMRRSAWLMLKAHFAGRSTLWVGAKGEAEQKQNEMITHGPDPNMLHKGAQPLIVTVEINERSQCNMLRSRTVNLKMKLGRYIRSTTTSSMAEHYQ